MDKRPIRSDNPFSRIVRLSIVNKTEGIRDAERTKRGKIIEHHFYVVSTVFILVRKGVGLPALAICCALDIRIHDSGTKTPSLAQTGH
jgi:hypothetical protein